MPRWKGLFLEDVQARAEPPVTQRGDEGRFVDNGTARRIHENRPGSQAGQRRSIEQMMGLRCERHMERDDVAAVQELAEGDARRVHRMRRLLSREDVGEQHRHPERSVTDLCDAPADAPEADDTQRPAP
jgi:hypothetical protein